jgi:N-succinyldiaminopimelate aminotransferase
VKPTNPTLSATGTTIFETMSALARTHQAVNLGQGFPDDRGDVEVQKVAASYLLDGNNQYPPMMGVAELRQAVARHNRRMYRLDVDWQTEVLVTSGATEALLDCFMGLLDVGDQVILFEPAYDTYAPVIARLGAVPIPVRLTPPDWQIPKQQLEAAFSSRTKMLVLNSPMNPSGKVFSIDEMQFIANLLQRHDVYAVCDEVYEHLTFAGVKHVPLMTLPMMRDRCVRIGSAGKTFSMTGWKIGYITAPQSLLRPIAKAHQLVTFTSPPNLQHGIAAGLNLPDDYFAQLGSNLARSRDRLANGLRELGLPILAVDGTYFLVVDVAAWMRDDEDDVAFCRRLVVDAGVVTIPLSAFYLSHPPRSLIRFCFSKADATIDEALKRLRAWKEQQP